MDTVLTLGTERVEHYKYMFVSGLQFVSFIFIQHFYYEWCVTMKYDISQKPTYTHLGLIFGLVFILVLICS